MASNHLFFIPHLTGTGWMENILENIEQGNANIREIPMLEEISRSIEGHTICALGDAAAWPVQGESSHSLVCVVLLWWVASAA